MIAIVIPVLGREHQIEPLLESIDKATDVPYRVIFICSPGDPARKVCRASDADTITVSWEPGRADFAKKINYAYEHTEEEWIFQGATDLFFHPGWASRVMATAGQGRAGVIGTNDLGNPQVKRGNASTHIFFSRRYIERFGGTFDGTGAVFSEAYDHNFVDTEFVQTAILRGQFKANPRAIVEHLHPHWGKGEMDATYEKSVREWNKDAKIHARRMRDARGLVGRQNRRMRR